MPKVQQKRYFLKFFHDIAGGPIKATEIWIYSIITEFEANKLPCFISRAELAKRINESESTAERSLQRLIKAGLIVATRDGRKRHLSTGYPQARDLYQNDTGPRRDLYQNDTQSVQNRPVDLYQNDTLIRSNNNQIYITRSNNQIQSTNYTNVSARARETYRDLVIDENDIPD